MIKAMTTPVIIWGKISARLRNRRPSSSGPNTTNSIHDQIATSNVVISAGMMAIVIGTRVREVRDAIIATTDRSGATKTSSRTDFVIVAIAMIVGNALAGNRAIGRIVGIVKTGRIAEIATDKIEAVIVIATGRSTIAMISDRNHGRNRGKTIVRTLGAMIAVQHPIA
jgi:hypothetical protein